METRLFRLHPGKNLHQKETKNTSLTRAPKRPPKSYSRTLELTLCSMLRLYNPMLKWAVKRLKKIGNRHSGQGSFQHGDVRWGSLCLGFSSIKITLSFHIGFPKHILRTSTAGGKNYPATDAIKFSRRMTKEQYDAFLNECTVTYVYTWTLFLSKKTTGSCAYSKKFRQFSGFALE